MGRCRKPGAVSIHPFYKSLSDPEKNASVPTPTTLFYIVNRELLYNVLVILEKSYYYPR